jgi:D-alanyl-D-alanine carboxypeptidase
MQRQSQSTIVGRTLVGLALGALFLASSANATSVDPAAIEGALKAQLEKERLQRQFPGATAAFVLPDGRSGNIAVGLGDAERGLAMLPGSRMPAGSIGKTFVAALALSLVAEGKLGLDDRLSKWLGDEEWFDRLPNGADIRIRNLLNHSAGLKEHVESPAFGELVRDRIAVDPRHAAEPRVLVNFILDQPPLFPVGKGYKYTDTGYIVLQLALEKAGGFRLGEEVVRRFLYPLQLNSTGPAVGQLHAGVVQGYISTELMKGLPQTALEDGIFRWNPLSEWAGGGFISNSLDLARWARALYDGPALPAQVAGLMVDASSLNTAAEGYAYGFAVAVRKGEHGREWGHNGVYPGYRSYMRYFPDCRIAVAFQINTDRIGGEELRAMGAALTGVVLDKYQAATGSCARRK